MVRDFSRLVPQRIPPPPVAGSAPPRTGIVDPPGSQGGAQRAIDAATQQAQARALLRMLLAQHGVRTEQVGGGGQFHMHSQGHIIQTLPVSNVPSSGVILTQECTVCYETFVSGERIKTLPCMHIYHVNCIDPWLERTPKCPVCQTGLASAQAS